MTRLVRRAPLVLAVLLLAAATLLPWFEHAVAVSDARGDRVEVVGANAWSASWLWSGAVVLGVLAGLTALRDRADLVARPWAPAVAVALALCGLALAVLQQVTVPEGEDTTSGTYDEFLDPGEELSSVEEAYAVQRGQLRELDLDGYDARFGVGSRTGLGLLVLQVAAAGVGPVLLRRP